MEGGSRIVYLVDFSRTGLEALESFLAGLVEFVVEHDLLGFSSLLVDGCLAVHEVDGEAFGVFDTDDVPATRGVFHLLNTIGENFDVRDFGDSASLLGSEWHWRIVHLLLELVHTLDFESSAQILLGTLLGVVDVLVWAIASIPSLSVRLLHHSHAEVCLGISVSSPLAMKSHVPLRKVVMTCRSGC